MKCEFSSLVACIGTSFIVVSIGLGCGRTPETGDTDVQVGPPILDQVGAVSYACAETALPRLLELDEGLEWTAMSLVHSVDGYQVARVRRDDSESRSTWQTVLSGIDESGDLDTPLYQFDGTSWDDPGLAEKNGELAMVWLGRIPNTESFLRFVRLDASGQTVVAETEIEVTRDANAHAPRLVATEEGFGLTWIGFSEPGLLRLRFVTLDSMGVPSAQPVTLASREVRSWDISTAPSSLLATQEGFAAVWTERVMDGGEVYFVTLTSDGTPNFTPRRISRPGSDDLRSGETTMIQTESGFLVAWAEADYTDPGPDYPGWSSTIQLARIDTSGQRIGPVLALQAPESGIENISPALLDLGTAVAVTWSSGSIVRCPGACPLDHTLKLVLLSPDSLVPLSNLVEQTLGDEVVPSRGLLSPRLAHEGLDFLGLSLGVTTSFFEEWAPVATRVHCDPVDSN